MAPPAPILIIGRTGMLGRALRELLTARNIPHCCVDLPEFDFTRPDTIEREVTAASPIVINCAAYTDVDGCETKHDLANAINAAGVAHLAARCKAIGAKVLHYSTDYVFNGQATAPYPVEHLRQPVNAYGRSKAAGEVALEESGCDYLLVRTSWLYAPWGKNFVRTITRLARERSHLKVVADQFGRPTSAQHLAATSLALLEREAAGTYHVTDGGQCSWHEFATAIAAAANPACRVSPCTTAEYPLPAQRPAYSVLDLSKTEALLGPMPPWQINLSAVLANLEPFPAPINQLTS